MGEVGDQGPAFHAEVGAYAAERGIGTEYLALLAEQYGRFFYHYNASPVLIVNSERLNFVDKDKDLDLLVNRLLGMRGGREFFNFGD